MRTNLSKKLLAAVLSLAMVLSLVGIQPSNANAASYKITKKAEMKAGKTVTYKVTGVKKTQYIKVTKKNANVTVKYNNKKVSTSKKIAGTGKALSLKVTAKEVNKDYTNKMTVKVYNKKNNKVVKTLTVSTKVLTQVKEEEPTPEEPTPEEPVEEKVLPVSLEATHVKELTLTISKEAEVKAADLTVKKGTAKVTPAEVKVEGTKVVITLGSKISEGTYSVTLNDATVEVKTEDEKLTSLATVGTEFSAIKNDVTHSLGFGDPGTGTSTDVAATIEYQALNQYGDAMTTEMNIVSSSFGGKVTWSEPTTKKNGKIEVYNIPAAIGIVGNTGKIIMVSKSGVSSTSEVTFSEEAKLAKVECKGIYNVKTNTFVDELPAQIKNIGDYLLAVKLYDQYTHEIIDAADVTAKFNGQQISQAKILTNVSIFDDGAGKIDGTTYTLKEIDGTNYVCLNLKLDGTGTPTDKTNAGSLQLIIVGNRFGSVFNHTINVKQIDLIESFSVNAENTIYAEQANEISYTAVSKAGKEVTDYETLKTLVPVSAPFAWEKQVDGSAKLIYTPAAVGSTSNENMKENTVTSFTFTCNQGISAGDTVVATKTFTVFEAPTPVSVVKFTGDVITSDSTISLCKANFVFEDQYGNTMSAKNKYYDSLCKIEYFYGTQNTSAFTQKDVTYGVYDSLNLAVTTTEAKCFIRVDDSYRSAGTLSNTTNNPMDAASAEAKADVTLKLQKVNQTAATNITAEWNGYGPQLYVRPNQMTSGISVDNFDFAGKIGGKDIALDSLNVSIKNDTYVKISESERETAVKTATVTFTVVLEDVAGDEYTEEVTAEYQYSAAPSYVDTVTSNYDKYGSTNKVTLGLVSQDTLTTSELQKAFTIRDQYGEKLSTENLVLEVSLSTNTDDLAVTNNNSKFAEVTNKTFADAQVADAPFTPGTIANPANYKQFTVVATEPTTGKKSTQKFAINEIASADQTSKTANKAAVDADYWEMVDYVKSFDGAAINNVMKTYPTNTGSKGSTITVKALPAYGEAIANGTKITDPTAARAYYVVEISKGGAGTLAKDYFVFSTKLQNNGAYYDVTLYDDDDAALVEALDLESKIQDANDKYDTMKVNCSATNKTDYTTADSDVDTLVGKYTTITGKTSYASTKYSTFTTNADAFTANSTVINALAALSVSDMTLSSNPVWNGETDGALLADAVKSDLTGVSEPLENYAAETTVTTPETVNTTATTGTNVCTVKVVKSGYTVQWTITVTNA